MKTTGTDLHSFLTAKAKSRKIRIEDLPELCNISRSSVYRYMKGIVPMPEDTRERFAKVLGLDAGEREIMDKLIAETAFDESLVEARALIDRFVFGRYQFPIPASIEFILYDHEKYFRTAEELFDMIASHSEAPDFSCTAKIINCTRAEVLPMLSSFLERMLTLGSAFRAEHLIGFADSDYAQNAEIFMNIVMSLPLAQLRNYEVRYSAKNDADNRQVFNDSIMLDISLGQKEHAYYWISFSQSHLSSCTKFTDRFLYAFYMDNYNEFRGQYGTLLFDTVGLGSFAEQLAEFESCDNYLLKTDPGYSVIPPEVYVSMVKRSDLSDGAILELFRKFAPDWPCEEAVAYQIDLLRKRNELSYKCMRVDIVSEIGLREFVSSGKISDHWEGLPAFSAAEIREILQNLRGRILDENDPYRLYIANGNLFNNGLILAINKGGNILVETMREHYQKGIINNIYFKNDSLRKIFVDYIENYLIPNHTLPQDEAAELLRELAESVN